jgi:DNA-binding MarR family transcriptional regulator
MTEADQQDGVPWLTPEQRKAWVTFVLASGSVMDGLDRQLQRDAGINRSHFSILQFVSMADGSARMSEVAAALRFSPSRLSHAVGRLERDGWLARRPDPNDGRGQLVTITDEGQRRIERVAPLHRVHVQARVFDHLTDEQVVQLQAISDALLAGIDGSDEAHRDD